MPTYEHKCPECKHVFDDFRKMGDASKNPDCPKCGHQKCEQTFIRSYPEGLGEGRVKAVGAGDTTTVVLNDDHTPYRFKEGTEAGQKRELKQKLEEREAKEGIPERLRSTFNIS